MIENIFTAESGPVVVAAAPEPSANDVLVERWFVDHFHNVPGLSTHLFNRFRTAADDLKAQLRAEE